MAAKWLVAMIALLQALCVDGIVPFMESPLL